MTFAAAGPSALWYLTRGTGTVSLILLTLSVVLGIAVTRRVQTPRLPRFVIEEIHRNVSLLVVAVLLVHIVTSVLDSFAPIRLIDTVLPFTSAYRPIWLGLGALASDMLIAVAVTSVMRRRLGHPAWRAIHWLAYACWPVAVVHGLGTGSDSRSGWMLALTAACVLFVIVSVWIRLGVGWPARIEVRAPALAASVITPVALIVWLPGGPLSKSWARRAGTPASLLRTKSASAPAAAPRSGASDASGARSSSARFQAQVSGTVRQGETSAGMVEVHLTLSLQGSHFTSLGIRIFGTPTQGGGVAMTSSRVTLGTSADRSLYRGSITSLQGTSIAARVSSAGHTPLSLDSELQIDPTGATVTGTLTSRPAARR